ncbi:MAG: hypothetical protein PHR53_01195 [Bacteroidales bacterium]|nr:hypothetical protein [Bacteroidales bacterium]
MKPYVVKYCLTIGLLLISWMIVAQTEVDAENRELLIEKIENLIENSEQDYDLTDILEGIDDLRQNPVAINSGDPKEIGRLFFLDDRKAYNIAVYTTTYGAILSLNELYAIEGINAELVNLMAPFITLATEIDTKKVSFRQIFQRGKHQIIARYQRTLQTQRGYMNDSIAGNYKYFGSPDKYYLRYRFKFKDQVSFGITAEKDAGEEFFKGSNKKGFDFYSAHLFLHDFGVFDKVVVGDYHLTFGQGLTMWSTLAFGKASDGVGVKRKETGITANTSINEALFMRGAATTLKIAKRHYITAFVSSKGRDGSFTNDTEGEVSSISSLLTTGLHRTQNEIDKRNVARLSSGGVRYQWAGSLLKVGVTGFGTFLNVPVIKDSIINNLYAFTGKNLVNGGIDFSWIHRKFELFGEGSYSSLYNGWAALLGIRVQLSSRIEVSLAARNYQKDYVNFYANAFGENSGNRNEQGIYGGFNAIIMPKVTLSGYADIMRFPYFQYNIFAPTIGNDFLLQANYTPTRYIMTYLRYRYRYRQNNDSDDIAKRITDIEKHSIRLHGDFSVTRNITIKSRFEYIINAQQENTDGFVMYADLNYKTLNGKFSASMRYAWFDTDTYDDRIYAYESDMLYQFTVPAYYYKGSRVYLLLGYKITDNLSCWLRVSDSHFSNQETISSSGETIFGNHKTEVKGQVCWKF